MNGTAMAPDQSPGLRVPMQQRPRGLRGVFPFLDWARSYSRHMLRQDVWAGLLSAFVIIPSAFGYAHLAGLAPDSGLYALIWSGLVFTLLTTSREAAVGPTARVSMLVAAALTSALAGAAPARAQAWAQVLSLMVGAMLLVAAALRLGALTRFFSRPVLIGYGLGSAVVILSSEFSKVLGLEAHGLNMPRLLADGWAQRAELQAVPVIFGLGCLATLLVLKRLVPAFAFVLLLVGATVLIALTGLDARGVRVVGELPAAAGVPQLILSPGELRALLPGALALFTVVFLSSTSTERSLAHAHGHQIRTNHELVALGAMNVASGLGGGFVVSTNSSDSRLLEASRAQTPVAGLAVIALSAATLAIGPTLRNLPEAALAAVVIVSIAEGVDWRAPARVWRFNRQEFIHSVAAFVGVLTVGLIPGLLMAAILSVLVLLRGASRPHTAQLGVDPQDRNHFIDLATHPNGRAVAGVLIYRLDSMLFFANEDFVVNEVLALTGDVSRPTQAVILDLSAVNGIDLSGYEGLERLKKDLAVRGIQLWGANAKGPLRRVFEQQGPQGGLPPAFGRGDLLSVVEEVRKTKANR
jgi:sulfate permease, SulP family